MKKLRVGIVGTGRIAQGLDGPKDKHILTMAHAITASKEFELGGFFDTNAAQTLQAEQKWSCATSSRNRAEWLKSGWDVIYIATPDAYHATDLADALDQKPRAIIVEKPLALDETKGIALLQRAKREGILVMVNYPRRWHSAIGALKDRIQNGEFGNPEMMTVTYSGGFAHNGVHLMDIFRHWFGADWEITKSSTTGSLLTAILQSPKGNLDLTLMSSPSSHYTFELQIYMSKGKIALTDAPEKLTLSPVAPHPLYTAYPVLKSSEEIGLEDEPMLLKGLEYLSQLLQNPTAARAHEQLEGESERFLSQIMSQFDSHKEPSWTH